MTFDEAVRFDPRRLADLYRTMGEIGAENVLCDTMEELTIQLVRIEKLGRRARLQEVREIAERIAPRAEQIGLAGLAGAARAVADCVRLGDRTGAVATMARLSRMGDKSLSAIWDPQGMML
ncbi:hypothetical protein [Mangrovicoccus algicola]|uniref:Uncharacterized protein n=1 Tax=Mangrovicoccus algicola TaxID=2771008 RepID=A0A8J6YWW0_9RHOB|nr:hypothetical protein [Mangrovicoccus algicola]MBE3639370.1 hypothetical protein [Mangrovicoccus algicola]